MTFLQEKYEKEVVPSLMETFGYTNPMTVPRLEKVIVNMGLGASAVENPKVVESATAELTLITGQKPVVTRARRAIAGFKLREGMPIGVKATLRGIRMQEFLERLIYVALPRVRDFKGISPKSFDGHGNYTVGVTEQIIFPEISYDKIDKVRGMSITVVTTAVNDDEARELLSKLGMPFQKPDSNQ
ncbi:50S ribosomal protein L5 [Bradymonas sediminis]|uniref:Large ribosomal subunit protein uL5 n=1 Tax=Bradymonas sediminis TaxID=1548548 RepID=A0A2Z4FGW1_9DELT|nr:50S ribosomal protein L5 [Bradymonas sediminis]AWV87994.1 50S ribosomal protein L5 [Bradymonas sediminis]TDP77118.1 LSU ribosomal protein L5P [Bradymonas sediminis]